MHPVDASTPVALTVAILAAATLGVASVDQAVKHVVAARLPLGRLYGLRGGVGLRRVANRRRSALGLSNRRAVIAWGLFAACTTTLLLAGSLPAVSAAGLGLSLGGAAGNLFDRVVRGEVVDFIAIGRAPTFNLADVAMVAGIGLVALSLP